MTTRRLRLVCLVAACLPPAAVRGVPPLNLADPPQGNFIDDWFTVELGGGKVGYAHATVHRDGERITSTMEMKMSIRRDATAVDVLMTQIHREYLDGTPVGFESTMTLANTPVRIRGRIRDGQVTLREEQFGARQERTHPFDPEALLSWGLLREQFRRGFKPGTKYALKTYEPSLREDGPIVARVEILGQEQIDLPQGTVRATHIRQSLDLQRATASGPAGPAGALDAAAAALQSLGAELVTEVWVDSSGNALQTDTSIGGISIRMRKATREQALKDGTAPELFLSTFIAVPGNVDNSADQITFRLRVDDDGTLPDLPDTAMQTFARTDARSARLTVRKTDWSALRRPEVRAGKDGLEQFLRPSVYADCANPRIQELTQQALDGATQPAEQADRLRKFVSQYVRHKNLSVGFATATEVAQSREGDCSEHGVLLAAMARAAGIPARVVAGIVRVPGSDRPPVQFGYHMWTQVHIGGNWVDIDAALQQTEVDVTHIAVSTIDLEANSLVSASFALLPLLGRLHMDVEPPPTPLRR